MNPFLLPWSVQCSTMGHALRLVPARPAPAAAACVPFRACKHSGPNLPAVSEHPLACSPACSVPGRAQDAGTVSDELAAIELLAELGEGGSDEEGEGVSEWASWPQERRALQGLAGRAGRAGKAGRAGRAGRPGDVSGWVPGPRQHC